MKRQAVTTILLASAIWSLFPEGKPQHTQAQQIPQPRILAIQAPVIMPQDEKLVDIEQPKINQNASWLHFEVTGYTCDPAMTEKERLMNCPNGATATGTIPVPGKTAACPAKWLGKQVEIRGMGIRKCEDTGGAITTGKIDVFFATKGEAYQFGRQKVQLRLALP